jgi:PAS domain S-box-containing protein
LTESGQGEIEAIPLRLSGRFFHARAARLPRLKDKPFLIFAGRGPPLGMRQPSEPSTPATPSRLRALYTRHGLAASVVLLCLLFCALLWTSLFVLAGYERARIIESKRQENDNLARVFEEHVARTIRAAEITLREIASEYRRYGTKFDLVQYAKNRGIYLDPYSALSVIDEYGDLVLVSVPGARLMNLSKNSNYQHHLRHDTPELFISEPRTGTVTGKWTVYLSVRLKKADGSFGGLAVVGMDPSYFSKIYAELDLGKDSAVILLGRDGIIRVRSAGANVTAGQNVANAEVFRQLRAANHGSYMALSMVDQVIRIFSYRALKDHPLVVVIGTSQAAALSGHEGRVSIYLSAAGTSTAMILALGVFALVQVRRKEKTNEALRASDDKFSKAFHISPDWVVLSNLANADFLEVNEGFERISGYSREEVIGRSSLELGIWKRPDERAALVGRLASHGKVRNAEAVFRRKDGEERLILLSLDPIELGGKKCMLTVGRDITESRQAAAALHASAERLNEAQRIAKTGNWSLDLATNVLTWSDEIFRIFEIDSAEFGATYEAFLNAIHPEDREAVNAAYTGSLKTRVPYDITHRLLMADGRIKYVHERCESHFNPDGKPIRSLGTVQDVTGQKLAELEIHRLNAELELRVLERTAKLEAANRELETFSYSVAHDLKAPLRGIDGYSLLLLEDYSARLDDTGRQFLANVRSATLQMNQLINDLLAYSRLERQDMQTVQVDAKPLIEALLAERADEVQRRGVAVNVALPFASVSADREGLAMALRNLLENAFKFTRDAAHPAIAIGGRERNGARVLWVRDNGPGFDMQYHDRIFAIFQRLHRMEDYPGTGIGLAIVKKAMERMGGRAWAESEPGKGATFYLEIPE